MMIRFLGSSSNTIGFRQVCGTMYFDITKDRGVTDWFLNGIWLATM